MRNLEDIQENLKRGVIDLVILTLLNHKDMYPYQLHQEIEELTDKKLKFYVGSMYAPLRRMLANGEISEHKEPAGERRFRNYYHLEANGRDYLIKLRREYDEMAEGMIMLFKTLDQTDEQQG